MPGWVAKLREEGLSPRVRGSPTAPKAGALLLGSIPAGEFETFDEAVAALQEMHVPVWRRPTETGRWRQVRGLNWRRLTHDELELIARRASASGAPTPAQGDG